jgi:hypothetical protein
MTLLRALSRRGTVVAAIVGLVLIGSAGTVNADPAGPTDYQSEILSIDPPTSAVTLTVIGGDSFIQLRADPDADVLVLGYFAEPYLRFLPGGEVQENRNSPTTYQNEERYGSDAPDFAQPDADPDWVTVASDGTYAWHDHRAHWMQPIRPAGKAPGDRIVEQVIPLVVDGEEVDVTVISTWQDEPSMLPAALGVVIGAVSVGGAFWLSRRNPAWAVALIPVSMLATVAGWWQFTSLPSETGPRVIWALLPSIALVASLAAAALGRRSPFAAVAAGLIAASQLAIWAFVKRDGLTAAIVPTDAPQWFERMSLTAAFVVGVGGVAIAIFQLFSANLGTRPAHATT